MKAILKVTLMGPAIVLAMVILAPAVRASHMQMSLAVPEVSAISEPARISATLSTEDGTEPVADAVVVFSTEASFGGVSGWTEIGRAVTNAAGVASVTFIPRTGGDHSVRVEYAAPGMSEPEVTTTTHHVGGSPQQLYQSRSGIEVPGLNVWILIATVSGVWVVLLSVAVRVIAIGRAGVPSDDRVSTRQVDDNGSVPAH